MSTIEQLRSGGPPEKGGDDGRRRWYYVLGALAIAVVAAVVLAVVITSDDDEEGAPPGPTTTTVPVTTTEADTDGEGTVTSTTAAPAVDRSTAIWPVAGSGDRFDDPVDAARDFAVRFLAFPEPRVGEFQRGDSRSGEVEIRPTADGPVTTVMLRQLTGEESWSVLGVATTDLEVTAPRAGDEIRSPVAVTGSALAFEGHVTVQVRQDGDADPLGEGFVTGGGDVVRPFAGSVGFDPPDQRYGSVVFLVHTPRDGSVWQAATVRVRLGEGAAVPAACGDFRPARPPLAADEMEVTLYFGCDRAGTGEAQPIPVHRAVPRSEGVLRASLGALLEGPTAEEVDAGISSWFSPATAGLLRNVTLSEGHAVVDLGDLRSVIPNASTSAGSALLLSQLDATVFQFPTVESVEYRLEGSCEAFTEWLQTGGCEPRTRR